jgi:hypothetical protein
MGIPFTNITPERKERLLAFALWSALAFWLVGLLATAISQGWGIDMQHFWCAARTILAGQDPYVQILQYPGSPILPPGDQLYHLPWVAYLFVPLGWFEYSTAIRLWAGFNGLLMLFSLYCLIRLLNKKIPSWGVPLVCMAVVLMEVRTLQAAQIGIFVADGLLLGMVLRDSGKPLAAGLAFTLILFKPWIAAGFLLPVFWFALIRKERAIWLGFLGGCFALVAVTSLLWPGWWITYLHVDFSNAFGIKVGGVYLKTWPVSTLFDFTHYILKWPQTPLLFWAQVVFLVVLAVLLLGLIGRAWQKKQVDENFIAGACGLLGLLLIPYVRYVDYPVLALWWTGVAAFILRHPGIPRAGKWLIAGLILVALSFPLGSHLEPWMYQLPLVLYAATAAGLLLIQRAPVTEPARSADGVPRGERG